MLPPGGQSDRFLITKETKLVGNRRGKFTICYVRFATDRERFISTSKLVRLVLLQTIELLQCNLCNS
jgi:hypothetical protein